MNTNRTARRTSVPLLGKAAGATLLAASGLALAGWGLSGTTSSQSAAAMATSERLTASATEWNLDRVHSTIMFKVRHAGVSNFYGTFNNFSADINLDPADPTTGSLAFNVKIASVDSRNGKRDDHLRNADFFNARQYPDASFQSTNIEDIGDGKYKVTGNFTMVGETREITAYLYDIREGSFRGSDVIGFEAQFDIKRSEFGMTKYLADDGSEDGPLGNTVTVTVAVEAGK